jgi:2-keto-3-deoxy-L-rhamnonate aldolase RhmA
MVEIGKNGAKAKLKANQLVLCMGINQMRTPNVGMIAASAGFDAIFVDCEHNPTDLETTAGICIGALGAGITPIVRLPSVDRRDISRTLDVGAQGVMVAHVDTAEEARAIVNAALFKPLGRRSAAGTLPSLGYRSLSQADVCSEINRETLVMAMIETEEGLANVEAIGAVKGLDALHIGANDLSIELGMTGQLGSAKMREAYARVAAAAKQNGLALGIGGIRNDPGLQTDVLKLGYRYLTCGTDVGYVVNGAKADLAAIRAMPLG